MVSQSFTRDALAVRCREPGIGPVRLGFKDEIYELTGGSHANIESPASKRVKLARMRKNEITVVVDKKTQNQVRSSILRSAEFFLHRIEPN